MNSNKNKYLNKLFSIKLWVTIWAMILISYIVFTSKNDFLIIAEILSAVPLAYMGLNVYQKKILSKSDNSNSVVTDDRKE